MVVNYANMFDLGSLSGSIYLNSILVGTLRYSTNLFCGFLDYKFLCFGRKRAHTSCQLLVLGSLVLSLAILLSGNSSFMSEVIRICVLIVCAMASQQQLGTYIAYLCTDGISREILLDERSSEAQPSLFQIVIVDSVTCNEFFPTSVRTLCYSFVQLCSRLGIVVAPHVYSWEEVWPYLPYTFMIAVTVLDVVLFEVLLPETKNKPLEDHIVKKPKKSSAEA
ncbi:unnamed protein product [Heligmosomoides polygyrus]|uniref:Cation_ATPase_C domain-containing protein n=1 Tax=Heligmosomoides polygyrus TaxID=6339 RepID=A0A3P8APX4_HELPZ|nr:unnamed protein product [Heligmosomoides polygyrus]